MAFFEELGNKVSQAGNKIAEAARNSSQTTQLENDIRNMQAEIDGCLHQMGAMLYYEKKDPEAPKPDYDPIIARIDQLTEHLNWAVQENDRLHGIVRCPQCRNAVPVGTPFCPACGYQFPMPAMQQGFSNGQQPMPQQGFPNGQQPMPQQGFPNGQQPLPQQGFPNGQQPMPQQGFPNGQQTAQQQNFPNEQQQ